MSITEDNNIADIGQEIWKDIMNKKSGEDTFCTFIEYMQLIAENNKGFQYQFLQKNIGTIFILQNTAKRSKEDIYVLGADGIIEQSIVKETL